MACLVCSRHRLSLPLPVHPVSAFDPDAYRSPLYLRTNLIGATLDGTCPWRFPPRLQTASKHGFNMMEQDDGFTVEKAKELKLESLPVRRYTCPLYETQGIKI